MKISRLIDELQTEYIIGELNSEISKIVSDSRKIETGSLFVCINGSSFNGHRYIEEAISCGAKAIVVEEDADYSEYNATIIKVKNTKIALSHISNIFYNKPSTKVNLVGITGTNGKTSISFLVSQMLQEFEKTVGVIGTIGMQLNGQSLDLEKSTPTTPDSLELQMILNDMVEKGASDVVMEVTSIALDQLRVQDCQFKVGVFTNLTEDHLDYHKTMEKYKLAKGKLFTMCNVGIFNIDDPVGRDYAEVMSSKTGTKIVTYALERPAMLRAINLNPTPQGTSFDLLFNSKVYNVNINLPGKFNVYNILAAIGTAIELGVPIDSIIKSLRKIAGAKGRFESLVSTKGYSVVVDYAHTPDALEKVLVTAKEFNPNNVITVFGCGGDRDKMKRAIMGKVSGSHSDLTIITSDNPRSEEPLKIIEDIQKGIEETGGKYQIIEDRKEAIMKGIQFASRGDIVIIAGKGHETYQVFKDRTIHFDDLAIVKEHMI